MKFKKLFAVLAAVVMSVSVAGCASNNSSSKPAASQQSSHYDTYMQAGIASVKKADYDTAADKFEQAYEAKKTAKAKAYENQADDFADAQEDIADYEFKDAKHALTSVINEESGYQLMTSRATRLRRKIQTVIDNFQEDINPLRSQAKEEYANKQYSQAAATCERILNLSYINGKYYRRVRRQVTALQQRAQEAAEQAGQAAKSTTSQSTTTGSYDGRSSANTSASDDTTVGGQAVSMSGRGQIRSRLMDLGFDQSKFSDQQIIDLFRVAYNNGHQSPADITAADVNEYLGR